MTPRESFIARHKHNLLGIVFDAVKDRPGRAQAMWFEMVIAQVEAELSKMFTELKPDEVAREFHGIEPPSQRKPTTQAGNPKEIV